MRVLHISPYPTPHDARFLRAMLAAGEDVGYLPLDVSREFVPDWPSGVQIVSWHGLEARLHLDPEAVRKSLPAFKNALRSCNPDLVQAGPACSAGYLTALSGFHPFIAMLWGHDILWDAKQSTVLAAMAAQTLRDADAILCDCNTVREEVFRLIQIGDKPVIQMPWGIELERYFPPPQAASIRQELGWQDHAVFVSARSWGELYGIDTLLDGFALACKRSAKIRLLLLGDGPLRPMVEARVAGEDLAGRIHLVGRIPEPEMPSYLACGDFYLSCSRTDGSSVTLLEAMALGLPAVVSDISGNREWVDNATGLLFETDCPSNLCECLLKVSSMPRADHSAMGTSARTKVLERADFERNIQNLIFAHRELVVCS